MKINLKDNTRIEGFDTYEMADMRAHEVYPHTRMIGGVFYLGKIFEVSEQIAKESVLHGRVMYPNTDQWGYKNYNKENELFLSSKESIQYSCDKEYCIIYHLTEL